MGLFDGIVGMAETALGGTAAGGTVGGLIAQHLPDILDQHGIDGVQGLLGRFEQSGFGQHVASWVGDGHNLPISPDQIQQALGSPFVASIAAKLGIDPAQAGQLLSQHLPELMGKLGSSAATPEAPAP